MICLMGERNLVGVTGDDPERSATLDGNGRQPGQRDDLLRDVEGRVGPAWDFGQEDDDPLSSCDVGRGNTGKFRKLRVMAGIGQALPQGCSESGISADNGDRVRLFVDRRGRAPSGGVQRPRKPRSAMGPRRCSPCCRVEILPRELGAPIFGRPQRREITRSRTFLPPARVLAEDDIPKRVRLEVLRRERARRRRAGLAG